MRRASGILKNTGERRVTPRLTVRMLGIAPLLMLCGDLSVADITRDSAVAAVAAEMPAEYFSFARPGGYCYRDTCFTSRTAMRFPEKAVVMVEAEKSTQSSRYIAQCTGTLLDTQVHILTAAHCVTVPGPNLAIAKLRVRVNAVTYALPVKEVQLHRGWLGEESARSDYDLALLELEQPVTWVEGMTLEDPKNHEGSLEGWSFQWNKYSSYARVYRCSIALRDLRRNRDSLVAPCHYIPGGSGGPLLSRNESGTRVIGVLQGYSHDGGNYWVLTPSLPELLVDMVTVTYPYASDPRGNAEST